MLRLHNGNTAGTELPPGRQWRDAQTWADPGGEFRRDAGATGPRARGGGRGRVGRVAGI